MKAWFLGGGIVLCLFTLLMLLRQDWARLTRPGRRALATVSGHRAGWSDGDRTYAAIYRFADEDGEHEVIDAVVSSRETPPVGTVRELVYPAGRPELARPPRLALWLGIYAVLLYLLGVLVAKVTGNI